MAHYSYYTPQLTLSRLPSHVSQAKLRKRLEEVVGRGKVLSVDYITETTAHVVLLDYEAERKLLDTGISFRFAGNTYQIVIEKMANESSDLDDPLDDEVFQYQPPDRNSKAICRYLSKTEKHTNALNEALQNWGSKLISLSADEVEALLPLRSRGNKTPNQICEECITNFIKLFSSWNETLEVSCSADDTCIISVLKNYQSECYSNWFESSRTILVTGPAEVVDEVKKCVTNHLYSRIAAASSTRAGSFVFAKVKPAVVRFVSKQENLKSILEAKTHTFAQVQIKEENNILTVCVVPCHSSRFMSHHDFVLKSEKHLKMFFGHFDSWKKGFDKSKFRAEQRQTPEFFKTSSGPDYFVKWFPDTATVIVTGTCEQVTQHKQVIEQRFGVSAYAPERSEAIAPYKTHSRSQQKMSSAYFSGTDADTGSLSSEMIPFDVEDILPAVLKYVFNNNESKKQLEKCCKKVAKVVMKNDQGHIQVYVIFKKKMFYSPEDEAEVFAAVRKYFDGFDSITKKYEKLKLKQLVEKQPGLFMEKPGVYIKHFLETGTVKITGLSEKISEKQEELNFEMNAELEEEILQPDIAIIQRQCFDWEEVKRQLAQRNCNVSITSIAVGKIQYKGSRSAILEAKTVLKNVFESLHRTKLSQLSIDQMAFLKSCEKSQKEFIQTGNNVLDPLYEVFKDHSIKGALLFQDQRIDLVCPDHYQSKNAQTLLHCIIVHFEVNLSTDKPEVPFSKKCKIIREKMECEAVYLKEKPNSKKILVFCIQNQENEMGEKIKEIVSAITNSEEVEIYYPMEEELAKHIHNPHSDCKLYKAKSVEPHYQNGQPGLRVICEEEDIDSVDMGIEDLKLEIVCRKEKIPGYSLHEYLVTDEKHLRVERETKCSIFLEPFGVRKMPQACHVSVKVGDILDEICDAIVNSTGKGVSFTGQVSTALARRYGNNVLAETSQYGTWIVKDQVYLCLSSGALPWHYVLNVATPKEDQIKKFIFDLLCAADNRGICSIALPTIGTGNMGLNPAAVAYSMKEALAEFSSRDANSLRDIRVVVYESSLFPVFKDIAPELRVCRSDGVVAKIYGKSGPSIHMAFDMLKKIRDTSIKTAILQDPSSLAFPEYVKWLAREICQKNDINLEWKANGAQEVCQLQGFVDNVKHAEEEIKKLLEADVPHNWIPMVDRDSARIKLDKTSREYQTIRDKFRESRPSYYSMLQIERIQNTHLFKQFKGLKEMRQAETKQLFHGTAPSNVDDICANNFDRGFAGENGTAYGRGVYFHVNSSYSVKFAGQGPIKCVFLAEVITGDYTQGRADYKAAPLKENSKLPYDSVVDNTLSPKIFVVFKDASVYPSYLITFR